jgi:transmembrane sensor
MSSIDDAMDAGSPPHGRQAEALAWYIRCERGLSAGEEADFEAWLMADPRHARLFNDYDHTWAVLGRATGHHRAASREERTRPRQSRRAWLPLAAAAAVVFLLSYAASWRPPSHYSDRMATGRGELRAATLPDGSAVRVNTDSSVRVAYSAAERRVFLEHGEAHFAVARDPRRPFVVQVGGITVRAVGTAFNVRRRSDGVDVLVTQGRVAVDAFARGEDVDTPGGARSVPAAQRRVADLVAGQGARVPLGRPAAVLPGGPGVEIVALAADEIQRQLAWHERRLEFESAPLATIVAEFNRYSPHQLVIGDEHLAARQFGGSFRSDDPAGLVRMLRDNFGISAETRGDVTVLRPAR